MATQQITKPQLLLTLRQHFPHMSLRRVGDMIQGATLHVLEPNVDWPASLAFGIPLDGTLYVTMGEEKSIVRPGEIFGMSQYEQNGGDSTVRLKSTIKTVHYLAFSHGTIESLGSARLRPVST